MMAAPSAADGLELGTVVDARYRVCQELGRGNMGTVYLATDELTGREIALKIMSARLAGRHDRVQRFLNEYELSVKVGRHENIVATLAQGRLEGADGTPYLVMERIVGPSLDLMLAMHRRLDLEQARCIALGIARGMEAMHRAGVVHRDIKPSNVIVAQLDGGTGGVAKLLDFGLATHAKAAHNGEQRPRLTLHEQIPGSAGYMAPEVAERAEPHPSADVFGFGMVLAELLTGRNPYEGMSRDEYLVEVTRKGWALPTTMLDQVDAGGLDALVVACTRRRAEERPSMSEVVEALVMVLEPRLTAVDSMAATNPRLDDEAEHTMPRPSPPSRWLGWLRGGLTALVVVLVLGGLGGTLLLRAHETNDAGKSEPPSPEPWSASLTALGTTGDEATDAGTTAEPQGTASSDDGTSSTPSEDGSSTGADEPAPSERRPHGKKRSRVRVQDHQRGEQAPTGHGSPDTPASEPGPTAAECELLQDSVSAMRAEGGWSRILFLIKDRRACFGRAEYRRLRVEALARSGKHEECIKAGANSDDPEVVAWVAKCREMGR